MSGHQPKPKVPVIGAISGRVKHDERGQAIWEWAVPPSGAGQDAAQRLAKLDDPNLILADDAPTPVDVVKENPLGTVKGYSPYDSGLLNKKAAPRKRDLKRLSEWVRLKKLAESRKPGED